MQVFFYNMRFVKLDSKESARLTIDSTIIFWQQARIPTRDLHKCASKLLKMYDEWKIINKSKPESLSVGLKVKYDAFVSGLDNFFDIAHADALTMIRIEEDKQFLES